MLDFVREAFNYFARQLIWGLIDDAVDWLRAKLRELLGRTRADRANEPAALPEVQTPAIFEADVVEETPEAVRVAA
jgi:hypothetical protein